MKPEIGPEEFAAWREDHVTQWVTAELARAADAQKAAWLELSWEQGEPDELQLAELRTRADAYRALAELSYEDLIAK